MNFYFLSISLHYEFSSIQFMKTSSGETELRQEFFTDQNCRRTMVNQGIKNHPEFIVFATHQATPVQMLHM